MKILHSADWHLDSPVLGRTDTQTAQLKAALLSIPGKVAAAAKAEQCDLVLLSGDLFDGPWTQESCKALRDALDEISVPVCISPGNHDYLATDSPWQREIWPENVHIFTSETIESISVPALDCRIYGAAFTGPEAGPLLQDFRAECTERYAVAVLHGDPTQTNSPYCPITAAQIRESGLDYLALGHIHKGGSLTAGSTLCAWPGCPMGRGFDELGPKGVLITTLDEGGCCPRFLPLDTPQFYDLQCQPGTDARSAVRSLLPAAAGEDFYRITLIGESEPLDIADLERTFSRYPNLWLRDRTEPPLDIWANAGEDTLEGTFFGLLRQQLETADAQAREQVLLAARICRQILEGREVTLP